MTPRRLLPPALALAMLAAACTGVGTSSSTRSPEPSGRASASQAAGGEATGSPPPGSPGPSVQPGSLEALACSIPHSWLLRTWRGYRPDRSAQIQILPKQYSFVGSGLPHVGPWDYVQRVPMLLYGPGYIRAQGAVTRPVTVTDIADTEAQLLNFPFHSASGSPLSEAILPPSQRPNPSAGPPKLIVTMIWDAGGMDVLNAWKDAWPNLKAYIPQGTWYSNATVGSSPTSTAQIHAAMGTGDFPDVNGVVAHRLTIGGRLTTPWALGPAYLIRPTLADLYDRAMGNAPIVGELATVSIHLGLLGHGSMWGGGDKDIAALRSVTADTLGAEGFDWNLPPLLQQFYRFPGYLNDVPGFAQDVRALDAQDGKIDGMWRTNSIAQLLKGFDTPARIPYETRVLEAMVQHEGFGVDAIPDLLYVNYKEIDYISHIWSMNSLEMRDAVVAQDASLKTFIDYLNKQVGSDNYVLVVTADHGSMISPRVSGGFQISSTPIAAGINSTFDHDGDNTRIVQLIQPTQIFIDVKELQQNGYTLANVSQYLMGLTEAQTAGPGVSVDPAHANDTVFQAAYPSSIMHDLPCLPEARG